MILSVRHAGSTFSAQVFAILTRFNRQEKKNITKYQAYIILGLLQFFLKGKIPIVVPAWPISPLG